MRSTRPSELDFMSNMQDMDNGNTKNYEYSFKNSGFKVRVWISRWSSFVQTKLNFCERSSFLITYRMTGFNPHSVPYVLSSLLVRIRARQSKSFSVKFLKQSWQFISRFSAAKNNGEKTVCFTLCNGCDVYKTTTNL